MADLGLTAFSRDRVIRAIFYAMGRVVFFTVGPDECRSWAPDKLDANYKAVGRRSTLALRGAVL